MEVCKSNAWDEKMCLFSRQQFLNAIHFCTCTVIIMVINWFKNLVLKILMLMRH